MRGIERPTLYDINSTITASLTPFLMPKSLPAHRSSEAHGDRYHSSNRICMLSEDLAHLCGHPAYKFLDVKNTPQVTLNLSSDCHTYLMVLSDVCVCVPL
jgi:hypothetical protein